MSCQLTARYQLSARHSHSTAVVGNSLYIWAGKEDGSNHDARTINHFSILSGEWSTRETAGDPPLANSGYSCSVVADRVYYFGGLNTEDCSYHNSLSELDTRSLGWKSLESTDKDRAVMSRAYGGMISFENDGIHHLLMIGGRGSNPVVQVQNANYTNIGRNKWRTNEHSMYNLSTRNWSIPDVIGQFMPPASFFVMKKIDNNRTVVFGGATGDNDDLVCSNILYVINTTINAVLWQRMKRSETIDSWPDGRLGHAATIITNHGNPILVITGGRDKDNIKDKLWILDFNHASWKKMAVPLTVSERWCHSLSSFTIRPGVVVLLTIGGLVNMTQKPQNFPKITMSTELLLVNDRQWKVGDTLDSIGMISGHYKCKYQLDKDTRSSNIDPQLQHHVERISADLQTSIQACREQAEQNLIIEEELKNLREELENVQEAHEELEAQEEQLEEEKECIMKKAKIKFQQMSLIIKEKDKALQETQTESQQQVSCLRSSLNEKRKELYDTKRELFDVRKNLNKKDMMLQQCQQDLDCSQQEKDAIQKEKERNFKDAQQQSKEKERLQQQLCDSQSLVAVLQKSNDEQERAVKNIERHKAQLQVMLSQSQDEKAQNLREFQVEKAALLKRLRESQEETRRYQNEISVLCDAWQIDEKEVQITDEELGRGSYGVVMVGIFRGLKVAVKYLHQEIASYYNQERFIKEMTMASLLRHPNLVQFIGATFGNSPLILTECMTTSLYHERKNVQLARPSILSIALQVALGLNYLHLQKPNALIHRDVSSPNILLDNIGPARYRAKVSDYGSFAKAVDSRTERPGNVAYSAPEAFNPNEHTPAMDVYSYCVLLMEMIINEAPETTVIERREQASNITGWTVMKDLVQRGINDKKKLRPKMTEIIKELKQIESQ